jgi:transcriptional regulator with XRE-family HTH domain
VTIGPHSSAGRARRDFGVRLREIRKDSGLTARALAAATGQHYTRISKIENGVQVPTAADVRAWCGACAAEDQQPDLLATLHAVESAYLERRRQSRAGMKRALGAHTVERYERTARFRIYEHNVMPGLFQTAEYCAAMLAFWFRFLDAPNDLDAAVAVRMERQRVLYRGGRRIDCLLEEQALRTWFGTAEIQAGQLDRLLAVMSLPSVSVGIIPLMTERDAVGSAGFWMFDDSLVALETPTASIAVDRPDEIALYARMFDILRGPAVYGAAARALVLAAVDDLAERRPPPAGT